MVSSALIHLGVSLIASLPIAYHFRNNDGGAGDSTATAKRIFVGAMWAIFLGIPLVDHDDMSLHSFETMMTASLAFMMALKLTQVVIYPPLPRKRKDKAEDNIHGSSFDWKDFGQFVGDVLFYMLPVSRTEELPNRAKFLYKAMEYIFFIGVKINVGCGYHANIDTAYFGG
mmetsp:Transcript_19980/g.43599  ORF Transcript_19980/g.43599 Transcript_19980/m.43599 type:complete len:171 (-) Transcript_19980:905-1417(-)